MTGWPLPAGYPITTAYGKRGSYWSCSEDSNGNGVHTGVDFACPTGTPVYATIAGDIRHRNYGSAFGSHQFAISPDPGVDPFGEGEVFYAHCSERLADGTRVEVGDYVGRSGAEGNVSGPHLHYEFHPTTKQVWSCSVHADPSPTLKAPEAPPDPEPNPPDQIGMTIGFGLATWYSGKKTDSKLVYPDGGWHDITSEMPPTGIHAKSSEHHFLYLRAYLPDPRSATRTIETRWVRSDGDETAYISPAWTEGAKDSLGYANLHFEEGSGLGGQWQVKVTGGTDPVEFTTRYAKTHIYYELSPDDLSMAIYHLPVNWVRVITVLLIICAILALFTP